MSGPASYGRLLSTGTRLRVLWFTSVRRPAFAKFGNGSRIAPPFRGEGLDGIAIGDDVYLGQGAWLRSPGGPEPRVRIGNRVRSSGGLTISAELHIEVEDDVLFARNVYLSDHTHEYTGLDRAVREQGTRKHEPVLIGAGSWIGQNAVIGPGVRIGRGAVVSAGSLVLQDVPDRALAAGSPARVLRSWADPDPP